MSGALRRKTARVMPAAASRAARHVHASIATLLSPGRPVPLTGLRDGSGVKTSADALSALVRAAAATPEGRARNALAAALMHLPDWHDGPKPAAADFEGRAAQQAKWLGTAPARERNAFRFIQGSRLDIETQAGGNPSWNAGIDYAVLLRTNAARPLVEAMYRKTGLDLATNLERLTKAAKTRADPAALAWMMTTSVPNGGIRVPVLAMQTSADPVAPPELLTLYSERVARRGRASGLRTVAVDRPGNCEFLPGEILAAVDAMRARLDRGAWGSLAAPAVPNAAAGASAAFVADSHRPFGSRVSPEGRK